MPSLHTTWGLFLIAGSITRRKDSLLDWALALAFGFFGMLTILGALAFGDHYFFDCVVAIPFAGVVYASFKAFTAPAFRNPLDWASLLAACVLFCAWVLLIRSEPGSIDPRFVWLLTASGLAYAAFALMFAVSRVRQMG